MTYMKRMLAFAALPVLFVSVAAQATTPVLSMHFREGEFRQRFCFDGERFDTSNRAGVSMQAFANFYCPFMAAQETTDPVEGQRLFEQLLSSLDDNISWEDNIEFVEPSAGLHANFDGKDKFIDWAMAVPNGATQRGWGIRALVVHTVDERYDTVGALSDEDVGVHAICNGNLTNIGDYQTQALMNWTSSANGLITRYRGYYHRVDSIVKLFGKRQAFIDQAENAGQRCGSISID